LSDDVVVEVGLDLSGLGYECSRGIVVLPLVLLGDDVVAQLDALVADVHVRPGDELLDALLGLSAEAAAKVFVTRHG